MNKNLNQLREEIDVVDEQIIRLLSQRMELILKVGAFKKKHGIIPLDAKRWQEVLNSKLTLAKQFGLDTEMIKNIYENIHKVALQLETIDQKNIKL